MSAWSLGADRGAVVRLSGEDRTKEIIGRVVRWIPGDMVVLYAGAINWVSAEPKLPSLPLLLVFIAATPVVVILGAFATRSVRRFDFVKAVLAVIAFGIWSVSVPRSGWQQFDVVRENPGWVTALSALGGLMFGLLASGMEREYGSGDYTK